MEATESALSDEGRRAAAIEQYRAIARGDWFDHLVFYNLGRVEAGGDGPLV